MSTLIEVKVPDIGDFKDIPVVELLVKVGDTVNAEDPLVMLESDKATVEVPSPAAGRIAKLSVKVGDKVSKDSLLLMLEADAAPAAGREQAQPAQAVARIAAQAQPVGWRLAVRRYWIGGPFCDHRKDALLLR